MDLSTENIRKYLSILIGLLLFNLANAYAQVGIGTTVIEPGAIFQIDSDSKGLMIPRIGLTSRTDTSTIKGTYEEGMWVYNTNTGGIGNNRVNPGYYFWNGSEWRRMFTDGFTVQFEQTQTVRSGNNGWLYAIPGLNQNFVAPYTGTYEITVSGYIACPSNNNPSREANVNGEYILNIDGTVVASAFVYSNTMLYPGGSFQALGRQANIVHQINLVEGQTYNIQTQVRQWQRVNVNRGSLSVIFPGNDAFWGIESTLYNGNILGIDNAQDAYMTITLLRQY